MARFKPTRDTQIYLPVIRGSVASSIGHTRADFAGTFHLNTIVGLAAAGVHAGDEIIHELLSLSVRYLSAVAGANGAASGDATTKTL